jgi:hypothetical protein
VNGDTVYLSPTVAGAVTRVKPLAPEHLVYLGVVANTSPGAAGRMYVRVQNGYEMNELHDVQSTGAVNNDVLYRDTTVTPNLWKPASIPTILGMTTVGNNLATIPNPSAISYIRIKADNTVDTRTPSQVLSDLGIAGTIILNRSFADTAAVTGTTTPTIIFSVLVPANTFQTNDWITSRLFAKTTGTGGTEFRVYLNTTAAVGGTIIGTWSAAANTAGLFERNFMITAIGSSGAIKYVPHTGVSAYTAQNVTAVSLTFNTTIDQYLVFVVANGAVTASATTNGNLITILR